MRFDSRALLWQSIMASCVSKKYRSDMLTSPSRKSVSADVMAENWLRREGAMSDWGPFWW